MCPRIYMLGSGAGLREVNTHPEEPGLSATTRRSATGLQANHAFKTLLQDAPKVREQDYSGRVHGEGRRGSRCVCGWSSRTSGKDTQPETA